MAKVNQWYDPTSVLGSRIFKTESARLSEALRFFRVAQNLSLCRKGTLSKFARYIRHGFLSLDDAQALLLGRLSVEKLNRYTLVKYYISSGFDDESSFYFKPSQLWPKDAEKVVESIIPFP